MNQKSKAKLNEEIRVLKLKLDIIKKHVRLSGGDPDHVIMCGMFFASQKKRKTVDELVSEVLARDKEKGKEYMAVLNIRDRQFLSMSKKDLQKISAFLWQGWS